MHCEGLSFPLHSGTNWRAGSGGANRDRTGDLLLAKQALSQLSYGPEKRGLSLFFEGGCRLVGLDGFEPSTPALSRRCSNQLSYRPWRTKKDVRTNENIFGLLLNCSR